jgi:hypothetical protein
MFSLLFQLSIAAAPSTSNRKHARKKVPHRGERKRQRVPDFDCARRLCSAPTDEGFASLWTEASSSPSYFPS